METRPVFPNPYRREYLEYKDSLINQLAVFIDELLTNTLNNPNAPQAVKDLNIKETISSFLNNQNEFMECDDAISENSSY